MRSPQYVTGRYVVVVFVVKIYWKFALENVGSMNIAGCGMVCFSRDLIFLLRKSKANFTKTTVIFYGVDVPYDGCIETT